MQKRQIDSLLAGTLPPFDATAWTELTTTSLILKKRDSLLPAPAVRVVRVPA